MTDNDARGRIEDAIKKYAVVDMRTVGYEDCWVADATEATDRILAIVREALLSEEAVEAAFTGRAVEVVTDIPVQIQNVNMDKAKAIAAAWQAAFPESQEPQ